MQKTLKITTILVAVFILSAACNRTSYAPIGGQWQPTYQLDRLSPEIVAFDKADAQKMPEKGQILFAGSSSFRFWKNASDDLQMPIINRAFGGSTFPEMIHYVDKTIIRYEPKTVVIYCENDLFTGNTKTPEQVRDDYVRLVKMIRDKLPKVELYFVTLKPSPLRWKRWQESDKVNALIKTFIDKDKRHHYIDITQTMLKHGRPDGSIFLKDSLHMNPEGYKRWTPIVKQALQSRKR